MIRKVPPSPPACPDQADFTCIARDAPILLSAGFHEAHVDVNERGTEAAAARAAVAALASTRPHKTAVFRADHLFAFGDKRQATGSLLFTGRVVNPRAH